MVIKRYTKNKSNNISPCSTFVLPLFKASTIVNNDNKNTTANSGPIPSANGRCIHNATEATTGIVKLILANADPSYRFKLFCILLAAAAFTAEIPSGSKTTQATIIPESACGAPIL